MTALSADRIAPTRPVTKLSMPIKAATLIYAGALVFNDAGNVRGGVPTAVTPVLGVADSHYDNTGGSNGAMTAGISVGGAVALINGASADALSNANIGDKVYAIDDQTVGLTSGGGTRPIVGTLINIDGQGLCWVKIDPPPLPFGIQGLVAGLRMVAGQHVTAAASDTIATGLTTVVAAFAVLDDAPVLTCDRAQASIGNQNGAPVAGSILLETFMPTSNANPTPIAATTFGKKVNYVAFGW